MLRRRLISTQRHRRAFAHLASEFEVIIADHCEEDEKDNDGDKNYNDDYDCDKKARHYENSGEETTSTESPRDIQRPSRFSSLRFYISEELPMAGGPKMSTQVEFWFREIWNRTGHCLNFQTGSSDFPFVQT